MSRRVILLIVGLLFVVGGSLWGFYWLRGGSDHQIPPCSELPNLSRAQKAIDSNEEKIRELEQFPDARGAVTIHPYSPDRCPGKGAINITYDNIETREEIKSELGDTFFGIPYTLSNV